MAKIHTHYDNLKVARLAPQEVIRAAYKALSQKYHPDKNPGDDKAARIMAILNSAYGTLSDPQRRREHDDWIAAEEWEIEWLESMRAEEQRQRGDSPAHASEPIALSAPYRVTRDPKWWFALAGCFALGALAGVLLAYQTRMPPLALASSPSTHGDPEPRAVPRAAEARSDAIIDSWAVAKPQLAEPSGQRAPDIKVLATTQLLISPKPPDCEREGRMLVAPNGEPWPPQSGYVDGFPVWNKGADMQLAIDNTANSSGIFVRVYDLDRRSNVRHAYVLAHDKLLVDQLTLGKYEVRYQNVDSGADSPDCPPRDKSGR